MNAWKEEIKTSPKFKILIKNIFRIQFKKRITYYQNKRNGSRSKNKIKMPESKVTKNNATC